MSTKVLILAGEGINCEVETAYAFTKAGGDTTIMMIQDFLELPSLDDFDILVIPGGFSYGDEIKSGKILAEKIKIYQYKNLQKFIAQKKPILGICNGFQILIQLGVFDDKIRNVTLTENKNSDFIDKWIELKIHNHNHFWFKHMPETFSLPVRHKEGQIRVIDQSQIHTALSYTEDINGSFSSIAALVNKTGNILGLMPHPEAAINNLLLPYAQNKKNQDNIALQIFKNAIDYSKGIQHAY